MTPAGPGAVITGLSPDPRLAGAVRIEVDGEPFATVAAEAVSAEGLRPGRVLDEAARERLGSAADVEAAYRTALRSLERRPFARADLGRRLQRKGHPRDAVAAALDRLVALGLLDDAAFASNYVETRAARGRGPARLTRDLLAMGVERRLIDRTLSARAADQPAAGEVPRALATRRAAQLGDLPRPVKRRRLLAFLARRGFAGREVGDIVREVVG
ncbi:MAG TPA: RecX family transcriptional regulator [Gemmatimonadales bacterium]|nr:RecX family transcriptional regulator [Gemmatimonadales bacterium]